MSSIEEFIKDPSEEILNSFVKQQLWELVDDFKISKVDKKIQKKELCSVVKNWLCENSLIVASPQRKRDTDVKGSLDIFSGLSFEERKEILQMQQLHDKELIKETKRYELEIEIIRNENVLRQREIDFEQKKNRGCEVRMRSVGGAVEIGKGRDNDVRCWGERFKFIWRV